MMSNALVILNGEIPSKELLQLFGEEADITICADGAANSLIYSNIVPNLIIGDLDSLSKEQLNNFKESEIIKIEDQETTDGEKALSYCVDRKISNVKLIGAFGKRLDHTLYNLELLKKFNDQGIKITCFTDSEKILLINNTIELTEASGTRVSIIPVFGPALGVTLEGFQFDLKKETLEFGDYSSISNRTLAPKSRIKILSGQLLLIVAHDLMSK